jgi:outer membrane protein TolC
MIKISTRTLFVAFSIMLFKVNAQEAKSNSFSLQQSIDYAIKNSPSHLNAELDLKNSIYRKREIAGAGLPQVTGSFDFKDYFVLPTQLIPLSAFNQLAPQGSYGAVRFGTQYNATAGLNISQLVFSSDYIFGMKAAKEFVNLSKISTVRSKSELVSQVTKAYYGVVINKERIKLMDANLVKLKKTLDDTKAFNQQGFVEQIDVDRLEVAYNNLKTEKDKVENLITLSESLLKFQMGYKLSDPITLSDSLNIDSKEAFNLSKINTSNRADLKLLQAQQTLYDIDIKRLKWGYLPTIAAYGSYQYNTYRTSPDIFEKDKTNALLQWYNMSLVGVTVNLNVFDGLQRHFKIQQAKITSQKNLNNIKNLEMAAELEATTAVISFANALSSLETQKRNMELAQNIYNVSQKKYEEGIGSNLEVINAQTSLRESETNYYNALYDLLISKTDYLNATGTLVK